MNTIYFYKLEMKSNDQRNLKLDYIFYFISLKLHFTTKKYYKIWKNRCVSNRNKIIFYFFCSGISQIPQEIDQRENFIR